MNKAAEGFRSMKINKYFHHPSRGEERIEEERANLWVR
jgi:hypothetical protein